MIKLRSKIKFYVGNGNLTVNYKVYSNNDKFNIVDARPVPLV